MKVWIIKNQQKIIIKCPIINITNCGVLFYIQNTEKYLGLY